MITKNFKKLLGFSLIELMVIVIILGLVVGFTVPVFRTTVANAKLNAASERLIFSLRLAQSASARVGDSAFLCASSDGASCSGSLDWSTGWIVVEQEGSVRTVLKVEKSISSDVQIRTTEFANLSQVMFTPTGRISNGRSGTFVICDSRGKKSAQAVIVTATG